VAGADVAYSPTSGWLVAAVVLLRRPAKQIGADWELVEDVVLKGPVTFPYVPGLLSFREAPILLECFAKLRGTPDLVLVDGHGIAHPRGFGIASHLGLWLGVPTVGCAKSRLVGEYDDPGDSAGSWTELRYQGKVVGATVRTRPGVKPIFVSPGHRVGVKAAVRLALLCGGGFRVPEPTRRADHLAEAAKRQMLGEQETGSKGAESGQGSQSRGEETQG
jgi:deoxyribonuclease V